MKGICLKGVQKTVGDHKLHSKSNSVAYANKYGETPEITRDKQNNIRSNSQCSTYPKFFRILKHKKSFGLNEISVTV